MPAVVRELAEAQRRTETVVRELATTVNEMYRSQEGMRDQLNSLRGTVLEVLYREHAAGFFGRLLRRVRIVWPDEMDDLMDEGIAAGTLDEDAALDLRFADLVVRGRRPKEDRETFLIVEISAGVGANDVERADRRAAVLRRLRPTLAAVGGDWATPEAQRLAAKTGVWQVLNGRTINPDG